ncbi:DUF4272 domain-containing protein [Massilia antarctica]|uniref:DUF4272 domain-containing protein n=1 Tax=Massilia antarctica TaxID=2765360 RepID=A0AA48WIY8_9BURK|nr:DUF4272 domain-containing protein [Massilia antarctica]QPI52603.1 DUF4272 domain-containing protein [Massilia antarctica]
MINSLKRFFTRPQSPVPAAPTGATTLYNVYCTRHTIAQPAFAHELQGRRDLSDGELLTHLHTFCGYVYSRGTEAMSRDKYHVILHLQRVQHHLSMAVADDELPALHAWARESNALLFTPDGHVRDPDGHVLINVADGQADAGASVPYPAQSWTRKSATEAMLAARGIEVPVSLPPLACEEEVVLRDRDEVIGRARALLLVALRAESVAAGDPMPVATLLDKMPLADDSLSPAERAFLALEAPSEQECAQFLWRYESLYVLQWALGMVDELPYPDAPCDTPAAVARQIEMRGPELRGADEIVDALDRTYRLHWHIRQIRLKKTGAEFGADADVVMERHHALNWLIRFQHADWDEVDTPT